MAETHPFFPSGEWEGFYLYPFSSRQYRMQIWFHFGDGIISGGGSDDINTFTWRGTYDKAGLQCEMLKSYPTHDVHYRGHADENGIWGTWHMDYGSGGFHIWPKGKAGNAEDAEEAPEAAKTPKMAEMGI